MHMNWNSTNRQLRQFGWASLVFLPIAAGVWSHGSIKAIAITASAGLVLAIVGTIVPRALKPLFIGLSIVAMPIGVVVNEIAMAAAFFLVIVPLGLAFRLMGRDALQLKIDRSAASYWQVKQQPKDVRSYFRRW
jgi:hypothetical protein